VSKLHALALFVAGLPAVAGAAPQEGGDGDRVGLIGTWYVVTLEMNGKRLPREAIKDLRFVFSADRIVRRKGRTIETEAAYRLDPSKAPKWLDMADPEGKHQATVPVIYSLEGVRLKLCFRADYKTLVEAKKPVPRPERFDGGEGSGQVLLVLERAKR
jgi:uncharacterized protein (TIGR03067 family)